MRSRIAARWWRTRRVCIRWVRDGWVYLALVVVLVLPLLWMAISLAFRSGLLGFSSVAPSPEQLRVFVTLIVGGLAAAATAFTALVTWEHNRRERQRLLVETAIKSLECLPAGNRSRIAGSIATMVVLGQQAVAMRVLDPAWKAGKIDAATATWLIGQVLQADRMDDAAAREAAAILLEHVEDLTNPEQKRMVSFPGRYLDGWNGTRGATEPPAVVRESMLRVMARVLLSRDKEWWMDGDEPPGWPTMIFARCAMDDGDRTIQASAAVLLDAMFASFPAAHELCELYVPGISCRVQERKESAEKARRKAGVKVGEVKVAGREEAEEVDGVDRVDGDDGAAYEVPEDFWRLAGVISGRASLSEGGSPGWDRGRAPRTPVRRRAGTGGLPGGPRRKSGRRDVRTSSRSPRRGSSRSRKR